MKKVKVKKPKNATTQSTTSPLVMTTLTSAEVMGHVILVLVQMVKKTVLNI